MDVLGHDLVDALLSWDIGLLSVVARYGLLLGLEGLAVGVAGGRLLRLG